MDAPEKQTRPVNPFLRELVVDLEVGLARAGLGVYAYRSSQSTDADSTTLVISFNGRPLWAYRFEFRADPGDACEWIRDLGDQLVSENLTAVYAVTSSTSSKDAKDLAVRSCVGLHEVITGARNRIIVMPVSGGSATSPPQPPMLLTQKLMEGLKPRWSARAALFNGNSPAMDVLVEAAEDDTGQLQTNTTQLHSPGSPSGLRMELKARLEKIGTQADCYARHLGGCSGMSREHIISESVLKLLPDGLMIVQAAPGAPVGRSFKKAVKELKWPVLCERHNTELSAVDKDGAAFFGLAYEAFNGRVGAAGARPSFVGERIERWLLKVACGVAALSSRTDPVSPAPLEWVQVLFGQRAWPPYFSSFWSERTGPRSHQYGFEVVTSMDSVTGRPKGITLHGMRMSVTLALGAFEGVPGVRRPPKLAFGLDDFELEVELIWP